MNLIKSFLEGCRKKAALTELTADLLCMKYNRSLCN